MLKSRNVEFPTGQNSHDMELDILNLYYILLIKKKRLLYSSVSTHVYDSVFFYEQFYNRSLLEVLK